MSHKKSLARRAATDRAYAFAPRSQTKQRTPQPLPTATNPAGRLQAILERYEQEVATAAQLLGYESVTAGTDRSHQYLATQLLRERDGNTCYLCRKDMIGLRAVVEHIIPISQGGTNEPHNVGLACPECNNRKASFYVSLRVSSGTACYHQPRM